MASDYIYETNFRIQFNSLQFRIPRATGEDSSRGGTRTGTKAGGQVQSYVRVEEQLQGSKEGGRGNAPACFDLPQVRANFVIARVGCLLLDMPQNL